MIVAVLFVLTAGLAAFAAYWVFMFTRLLPLERSLGAAREANDDLRLFTLELLDPDAAPVAASQSISDLGQRAVAALQRRFSGLSLCWLRRRDDGLGTIVAHRGRIWSELPAQALGFETAASLEAQRRGGWTRELTSPAPEEPLFDGLMRHGARRLRLAPWGGGSAAGMLLAADPEPSGQALAAAGPYFDIACRMAAAVGRLADELQQAGRAKERLQGGLSAAIDELNDTHSRLIAKSREVKTLHDVALTLVSRNSQVQSALSAIVSIVAKYLQADLVAFLLLDEATGELVSQPGAYGLEGEDLLYRISLKSENSSSVRAFATGQPFVTGDAQNDPQVNAHYARLWKIHSLMVIPLKLGDRCLGVMRVGSFRSEAFSPEQVDLMIVIAEEASVLVETAILNRRLSEVAEQLAGLSRIKDEFVSTVSHEFKTPLTTIIGFVTVMLDGDTGKLTAEQGRFLGIIKAAAKRLGGLVSDLLDISKLEGGGKMEMKPLELDRLVRASLETHLPQAHIAGKTVAYASGGRLPPVVGDERWLTLVVDNLLSNALKFSREGGAVRVELAGKGDMLMVSVADDGIGIHAEDKERVFEKFYRARNRDEVAAPGTGLGLAIAKEVINKHGGKIWFDSEAGKGSKFYFVLPAQKEGALI